METGGNGYLRGKKNHFKNNKQKKDYSNHLRVFLVQDKLRLCRRKIAKWLSHARTKAT